MYRLLPKLFIAACCVALLSACGSDSSSSSGGGGGAAKACSIDGDCGKGETCQAGQCKSDLNIQGADSVGASSSGGDAGVTDGGGSSGSDGTATSSGGDGGGTSSSSGASQGALCKACKEASECGAGFGCVMLFNSDLKNAKPHFCLKTCSNIGECDGGFQCNDPVGDGKQTYCVPPNVECSGCTVDGCAGNQKCDYKSNPPKCADAAGPCDECKVTADCGNGHHCLPVAGKKICAPACQSGSGCPANSTCQTFDLGVKACVSEAETCCYGDSCKKSDKCASCADKCFAGTCVECTKDEHCPDGACVTSQHTCQQKSCPTDKPHKQQATGLCVECLNNTHCGAKQCLQNKCSDGGQANECSVCKAPYPGCVQLNGVWSCVECDTDAQCDAKGAGTCSTKTYTCSGTVTGGGPTKGDCVKSGCPAGTTSFSLECDQKTGLCFDKNGQCDNVTAFCNATAGSKCIQMSELFGGGLPSGGGSIPGLPTPPGGGSAPGNGVCSCGGGGASGSCNYDDALCKAFSLSSCDCCTDPKSKACDPAGLGSCCQATSGGGGGDPLTSLLGCLSKMNSGGAAPECFGGTSCLPIGCLFAGMGGGTSKAASGYCSAQNAP